MNASLGFLGDAFFALREGECMNIVDQYNLTLQIEVVKEQSAETLARLCKLVDESGTNHCIEFLKAFSHIVNTELYLVTSIDELESLKLQNINILN